jgi:D-sedoheptulose 7-phosphate isomerase
MEHIRRHLEEAGQILKQIDKKQIQRIIQELSKLKKRGGRLFFLGLGGSAANCSHAVNDFRKIAGIEAYAPTDNVSELTARINDEGWTEIFREWLKVSRLSSRDMVFVFSVGGGDMEKNISPNLVSALKYAKQVKAGILGIVGRDGGFTAQVAQACALVPVINPAQVTPHTEAFQAVLWHLIISHPDLKSAPAKWESVR